MEEIYDVNKICRTCLTESQGMKTIFEVTISEEHDVKIVDFIRRLTSLKIIKCDALPSNICIRCIEVLCKAFSFAQMCLSSDSKLKLNRQSKKGIIETYEELINNKENISKAQVNITDINNCFTETVTDEIITIQNESEYETENVYNEKINVFDENDTENPQDNTYLDDNVTDSYVCKTKLTKVIPERLSNCQISTEECPDSLSSKKNVQKLEKCEVCNKSFAKIRQLKIHLRSHVKDEEKQFSCKICGQKFNYMYLLKKHSYKHQDIKPYPCSKCDKGCITAESLKRHMRMHDDNYVKKMHICDICSKEFPYPSFLAEHMKNHTGEKPFLCSICGKGFRQIGTLHYHMRSHTGNRPFSCNICQNSFKSPGVLRIHMRRHTGERPYVCDVCGVAFRQSTDMKSHKRTHTGDKPVLCTICGKRLSSTGQLTIHIRSHTGEKPFSCKFCIKAFTTRTMLVKHERIHTGERPYVCKVCGKAFSQSSSLKTHMNIHSKKGELDNFINGK